MRLMLVITRRLEHQEKPIWKLHHEFSARFRCVPRQNAWSGLIPSEYTFMVEYDSSLNYDCRCQCIQVHYPRQGEVFKSEVQNMQRKIPLLVPNFLLFRDEDMHDANDLESIDNDYYSSDTEDAAMNYYNDYDDDAVDTSTKLMILKGSSIAVLRSVNKVHDAWFADEDRIREAFGLLYKPIIKHADARELKSYL
ncbi:hypothetical protein Ahy_A06g029583 [Arachis hypogaea]|uniref:Uncharacterized protein n=1 Tax=Arachis hypogaea TaxID=3818 RepID=A0A445CTS5_ARAHY|nr:hypothetical protein Ahy_A06g029583 [Arachis hypogaea]